MTTQQHSAVLTWLSCAPVQHQVVGVVSDEADMCGAIKALRLLQHDQQLRLAAAHTEQHSKDTSTYIQACAAGLPQIAYLQMAIISILPMGHHALQQCPELTQFGRAAAMHQVNTDAHYVLHDWTTRH